METYLDSLNEVQRQAVTHTTGPSLVIAGPGSGKTRVLTSRIAYLIQERVNPWQILSLTFTNKAAREMKDRIVRVAGAKANDIWAGTFHSIFAKILRIESSKIGFPSDFSIYDTQDAKSCISEIVKNQGLDTKVYNPSAIYNKISLAKNNLISPQAYAEDANRLLVDKRNKMPWLYKIYDLYVKKCKRSGAMDFDDLLYQMYTLLQQNKEDVLEKYRRKFQHVLVDEFQDTNQLQYGIIKKLVKYPGSEQNICVVGDDAQSIYAFRGATIQNILNFEKDFSDIAVYKLEQNYRSTNYIVQAANDIISKNSRQIKKTIFTEKKEGYPIKVMRSATDADEAKYVTQLLMEQKNQFQLGYDDFAILYRTNAQSRIFEESLKSHRIPYKIYGGTSFYDRKEIKDCIAYLRAVINPNDNEAMKRIVNYPARGIGATTVGKVLNIAESQSVSMWHILCHLNEFGFPNRTLAAVSKFVEMIHLFRSRIDHGNAYELASYIIKMSGILTDIRKEKTIEAQTRLENVTELLDSIQSFVEEDEVSAFFMDVDDKSLSSYLQNVVLITDQDSDDVDEKQVKLMSVHSSKGLEFRSVFIVGLEENLFPSQMAIRSSNPKAAMDEERRLFYVAVTRAEQLLTFTYATSRFRFGSMVFNSSSRFIEEISPKYMDVNISSRPTLTPRNQGRGSERTNLRRIVKKDSLPQHTLPADFTPSPISDLVVGATVLHERFGQGSIIQVDGLAANKVATIRFEEGIGEKRIMLKFARIQVIS